MSRTATSGGGRQMWSNPTPAVSSVFFTPSSVTPSIAAASVAPSTNSSSAVAPVGSSAFVPRDPQASSKLAARKKAITTAASTKSAGQPWPCITCTFLNKPTREQCEMCETPNPRAVDPPAAAIVAASKPVESKAASSATASSTSAAAATAAASTANGVKPKLPTPAPAPVMLVSPVSATFKSSTYENGLITACNNLTYDEVMRRRLIGLPRAQYDLVRSLKHKQSAIFLLNMESKELFGIFEAEGAPALDIEPNAWTGQARSSRFPAQCRFTIAADFETPIQERHYRELFKDPSKRIRTLSADEVKKLIKIFQAKSKIRKIASVAPVQTVVASNAVAATPASSTSSSLPATTGANLSRRNSVDSTASDDTKPKKTKGGLTKINQTCKRWLADECTHTDEMCKYLHVPNICRAFQRGTCPKGANCPFVHDKVDREHYKHGRNYCQKTAVHTDLIPPASTTAAAKPATTAKFTAPKDSLDSILSGLGSWKMARKASEPEPEPAVEPEATANGEDEESVAVEEDVDEVVQEFEQDVATFEQNDDGAVTFEQGGSASNLVHPMPSHPTSSLFMDGGLSFDMSGALAASSQSQQQQAQASQGGVASASQSQSQGWSAYDSGEVDDGSGGMFFAPPSGQANQATNFGAGPAPEEEFPWFNLFRVNIVQPALQAVHQREQQTGQKMIGPD